MFKALSNLCLKILIYGDDDKEKNYNDNYHELCMYA